MNRYGCAPPWERQGGAMSGTGPGAPRPGDSLTPSEAAEMLGVTVGTVMALVREGLLVAEWHAPPRGTAGRSRLGIPRGELPAFQGGRA